MLTTLVLSCVIFYYAPREFHRWVRECRCMYLGFCSAVMAGAK